MLRVFGPKEVCVPPHDTWNISDQESLLTSKPFWYLNRPFRKLLGKSCIVMIQKLSVDISTAFGAKKPGAHSSDSHK